MSIEAMRKALNYIENTEGELGIKLSCGDALREALAAQPPAAPVDNGSMHGEYTPAQGSVDTLLLLQARYVLKNLNVERPGCGYDKLADACGAAAQPPAAPVEGEKSARDYEHGYNDGVEWAQTHGLRSSAGTESAGRQWIIDLIRDQFDASDKQDDGAEAVADAVLANLPLLRAQPQGVSQSSVATGHERQNDHRVYFMCECCQENDPENGVFDRSDIGVMPDGTWLCDNCYSDCDKTAYGMVPCDVDDFEFPRFEDLPRPAPYPVQHATPNEPQLSAGTAIAALAKRFWSIHPRTLDDKGLTREEFYASEMVKLFGALTRNEPQTSPMQAALEKAERELTDLARPICCVFNRSTKKYEFEDEHIAKALPGTFEVIQQIRAALSLTRPPRGRDGSDK